jgi:hypothetical protein
MKCFATFLSLLMLVLFGCSKPTHPPVGLSQRIAEADHIVATNRNGIVFSCTKSGADVSGLATAVKSGTKKTWGTGLDWKSPFVWDVEFYTGTNALVVMHLLKHGFFQLEGVEYIDSTGGVEAFWKKLEDDRTR